MKNTSKDSWFNFVRNDKELNYMLKNTKKKYKKK